MKRKYGKVSCEKMQSLFDRIPLSTILSRGDLFKRVYNELVKVVFPRNRSVLVYIDQVKDFTFAECKCTESNVHFIIYYDGEDINAYIPKQGNLWCPVTKAAYGSTVHKQREYAYLRKVTGKKEDDMSKYIPLLDSASDRMKDIKAKFIVGVPVLAAHRNTNAHC